MTIQATVWQLPKGKADGRDERVCGGINGASSLGFGYRIAHLKPI